MNTWHSASYIEGAQEMLVNLLLIPSQLSRYSFFFSWSAAQVFREEHSDMQYGDLRVMLILPNEWS